MEGVTVLREYVPHYFVFPQDWMVGFIILGVGLVLGIIFALMEKRRFYFFFGLIGGMIGGILLGSITALNPADPVQEVKISDTVPYKAFSEKYEVIEVYGDIYTIRER
jgi:hypothetical protein